MADVPAVAAATTYSLVFFLRLDLLLLLVNRPLGVFDPAGRDRHFLLFGEAQPGLRHLEQSLARLLGRDLSLIHI